MAQSKCPIPYRPDYQTDKVSDEFQKITCVLVNTEEKYRAFLRDWQESPHTLAGFDLETTSLNPERARLVGCSIAFDKYQGYYFPFGHRFGQNLPMGVFRHLQTVLESFDCVLYYNSKFDLVMQQAFGHDTSKIKDYDMMAVIWNWDTNLFMPSLKGSAKRILGWDLTTYEKLLGQSKVPNLSYYSPVDVVKYAVLDAVVPIHLFCEANNIFLPKYKRPVLLDNTLVRAIIEVERRAHPLDFAEITRMAEDVQHRVKTAERNIRYVLGDIDIESNQQITQALKALGVDSGKRTATGQIQLQKNDLAALKGTHPVIDAVLGYREGRNLDKKLKAFQTSYRPELGGCRLPYKTYRAPTGRLAGGEEGDRNTYFGKINVQAIDKSTPQMFFRTPADSLGAYPGVTILGHRYIPLHGEKDHWLLPDETPLPDGEKVVEGQAAKDNLRRLFICKPGHLFVHFDYNAQELRIPTNLSRDPIFVQAFQNGEDPHRKTAVMMWGEASYNALMRKRAKTLNFSVLYGISPWSLAQKMGGGVTPEEAKEYIRKWWGVYQGVNAWARDLEKYGMTYGYLKTALGRKRSVRGYFEQAIEMQALGRRMALEAKHTNNAKLLAEAKEMEKQGWSRKGFALRTCVNTVVQGTAGDLMRLVLIKVIQHIIPKYGEDRIQVLSSIHDEINLSISPECLEDAIRDTIEILHWTPPDWPIPMEVGMDIGTSWGEMFPHVLTDTGLVAE